MTLARPRCRIKPTNDSMHSATAIVQLARQLREFSFSIPAKIEAESLLGGTYFQPQDPTPSERRKEQP